MDQINSSNNTETLRRERGMIVVVSGPAGSGKGTIVKLLLDDDTLKDELFLSVSATTRAPRVGEIDGVHYHFMTKARFEACIARGEMLEYNIYRGEYYGTPKASVESLLNEGKTVILEIDVNGAFNVKQQFPDDTVLIMLTPPDYKTLEARLRGRGTNTDEDILARLEIAKGELALYDRYDYVVINYDNRENDAERECVQIIRAEKRRSSRSKRAIEQFFI